MIAIAVAIALGYYSGLPSALIPSVVPSSSPVAMRSVKLFFYNPELDKDASGNIMCSTGGSMPATREIPFTNTPIQDTIRLLLITKPTSAESAQGMVSELPLKRVTLTAASLTGGVLTLTFNDPDNRTGGGSCFVSILRAQIENTAKQFSGVREVRLMPEELFQP